MENFEIFALNFSLVSLGFFLFLLLLIRIDDRFLSCFSSTYFCALIPIYKRLLASFILYNFNCSMNLSVIYVWEWWVILEFIWDYPFWYNVRQKSREREKSQKFGLGPMWEYPSLCFPSEIPVNQMIYFSRWPYEFSESSPLAFWETSEPSSTGRVTSVSFMYFCTRQADIFKMDENNGGSSWIL